MQELLKDIAVNFLSDALWALGGIITAKYLMPALKKSGLLRSSQQEKKAITVSFFDTRFLKKSGNTTDLSSSSKKVPNSIIFDTIALKNILQVSYSDLLKKVVGCDLLSKKTFSQLSPYYNMV